MGWIYVPKLKTFSTKLCKEIAANTRIFNSIFRFSSLDMESLKADISHENNIPDKFLAWKEIFWTLSDVLISCSI